MALPTPRCFIRDCRYFIGVRSEPPEVNERNVCMAFPDGIPQEIAYGKNPHDRDYPGDNGIRFKRREND